MSYACCCRGEDAHRVLVRGGVAPERRSLGLTLGHLPHNERRSDPLVLARQLCCSRVLPRRCAFDDFFSLQTLPMSLLYYIVDRSVELCLMHLLLWRSDRHDNDSNTSPRHRQLQSRSGRAGGRAWGDGLEAGARRCLPPAAASASVGRASWLRHPALLDDSHHHLYARVILYCMMYVICLLTLLQYLLSNFKWTTRNEWAW